MLHADQDGEKLQALLRLLTELIERVRVVDALSTVPQMYCLAVVEVVRRKMFMRHYREGPGCQPLHVPVPAPLEDLSPDSIDAQTFDFETIGHPNMDPVLQQGSLDLDSLAESPESDFMSAVNEFVIEENLTSPNPISDPTSPEMMVESLYSSVINAIDNRRMQDTTTLEKENSRIAELKKVLEKYRRAAEESHSNLRSVKDDLYYFRGLVLKEHQDFGLALCSMATEMRSTVEEIYQSHKIEINEQHKGELLTVRQELEKQAEALTEENQVNQSIVRDVQRAMLELEGLMERKEKELTQLENERERWVEKEGNLADKIKNLEQINGDQTEEIKTLSTLKDSLTCQLENLHFEIERSQQKIRQELEAVSHCHLKELEDKLKQEHKMEVDSLNKNNKEALEHLTVENGTKLTEAADHHATAINEKDVQIKEMEARLTELAELRCRLEVELALKESETEEVRILFEEAKMQQAEAVKTQVEAETKVLKDELTDLKRQLQAKNEEYEVDLAELRTLMRMEKDHCISELVDRHEEETILLHGKISALQQHSQDVERNHAEQQETLREELHHQHAVLSEDKEKQLRSFQELEQELRTVINNLQAENDLLSKNLEQERHAAQKEEASNERLQQERASLQAQIELLEKKKNEEMQNLKTSLIAEQQVCI
ncbi:hypothetical protein GOODEAATRI_027533 [Goodea atripinnis]|uniref:Uncharacterized protein n=1 Tax=Goodea atripinnis TaxID=208336 RepID=A0ABV0PS56_9TELE